MPPMSPPAGAAGAGGFGGVSGMGGAGGLGGFENVGDIFSEIFGAAEAAHVPVAVLRSFAATM